MKIPAIIQMNLGALFRCSIRDFCASGGGGSGGGDGLVCDFESSATHREHFGATNATYSLPKPIPPDLFSQTGLEEPMVPHLGHLGLYRASDLTSNTSLMPTS